MRVLTPGFAMGGAGLLPPDGLEAQEALSLDHHRHLFVNDYVIAELDGVNHRSHQPIKHSANPVLRAEHPWESEGLAIYGTVMLTGEGRFRMWHRAQDAARRICDAESTDGVTW